jgi:hypothetical protein
MSTSLSYVPAWSIKDVDGAVLTSSAPLTWAMAIYEDPDNHDLGTAAAGIGVHLSYRPSAISASSMIRSQGAGSSCRCNPGFGFLACFSGHPSHRICRGPRRGALATTRYAPRS